MAGVIVQTHQRLFPAGQGDRLEHRIDRSLRFVSQREVVEVAPTRMDFAVLAHDSPRGPHAFDLGLAGADAVEGLQPGERAFRGCPHAVGRLLKELHVGQRGWALGPLEQPDGVDVGHGCGLLVVRMHRDPRGSVPAPLAIFRQNRA